ncbi:MAG: bestrophin family ion channel, partial [Bacteroidota bacterium]
SLIGVALAFFLGFKTNSSYDRQWEARKIYGAIVNTSRSWGMMMMGFISDQFAETPISADKIKAAQKDMIMRHIAWMTALRYQLRMLKSWEHQGKQAKESRDWLGAAEYNADFQEELGKHLDEEELKYILSKKNRATQLLNRQSIRLKELRAEGLIDDFRHMEMENLLVDLFTQQGKCERIKNYPFPRQYASINHFYIWIFIALLPFGLIGEFADFSKEYGAWLIWLTVPFSVLVSWIFYTMEKIGDYSENPFEGLVNDIPITSLSRTIEIDLMDMLDEENLPEKIPAFHNFQM